MTHHSSVRLRSAQQHSPPEVGIAPEVASIRRRLPQRARASAPCPAPLSGFPGGLCGSPDTNHYRLSPPWSAVDDSNPGTVERVDAERVEECRRGGKRRDEGRHRFSPAYGDFFRGGGKRNGVTAIEWNENLKHAIDQDFEM